MKGNYFCSACITFGEFQRSFICLCSRVSEVATVEFFRKERREFPRQQIRRRLNVLTIHHNMEVFINLILYCFNDFWMAMTEVADAYAGDQINIPFAIGGIEINSFSTFDLD